MSARRTADNGAPRWFDDEPRWGLNPQNMKRVLLTTPDGKPLVEGNSIHFPLDRTPTRITSPAKSDGGAA